jgi:formylglycine-generating enzyme required for sulfatase activity
MIGTASEWTRSLPRPYPYNPADGREDLRAGGKRVLRGGSFDDPVIGLDRSAARDSDEPDADLSVYGFRVALSQR